MIARYPIDVVSLSPGKGVGVIKLGAQLFDVINHFKKADSLGFMRLGYSRARIFETPIIVYLKNIGLRLIFDPIYQRLILIEVVKFTGVQLCYNNSYTLNKKGASPLFKEIYNKSFGPTLPGEANFESKSYVLNYPGISFSFQLNDEITNTFPDSNGDLDVEKKEQLILMLTKGEYKCDSIAIYDNSFDSYSSWRSKFLPFGKRGTVEEKVQNGLSIESDTSIHREYSLSHNQKIAIKVCQIDLFYGLIRLAFEFHPKSMTEFIININETKQESVLYHLGEPDSTHLKMDSRFEIYNHIQKLAPKQEKLSATEVFHNYFRYGFDILYDTSKPRGATVKKVIIHNSVPNALDFNLYNKLNWVMLNTDLSIGPNFQQETMFSPPEHRIEWDWSSGKNRSNIATSEMYFDQINDCFKHKSGKFDKSNFISIDRNNLLSVDNDSDVDLIDVSVDAVISDDEDFENLPERKPRRKSNVHTISESYKRGQSKLYGHDRCVWEVLSDNDVISCLTLYLNR